MIFTKQKLAAIVSGAALLGTAQMASAVINVDATTTATAVFASEISQTTTGLIKLSDGGAMGTIDLTGILNPNDTPASTDVRVTLTLGGGATFTANPTMGNIADQAGTPVNQPFPILSGGAGTSAVTFTGNSGGGFVAADTFTIAVEGIDATGTGAITGQVLIQSADNFGATTLKDTGAKTIYSFSAALAVTFPATPTVDAIDVENDSKRFLSGTTGSTATADSGDIVTTMTARLAANSAALTTINQIVASSIFTVTGANGLAAFSQTGGSVTVGGTATTITGNDAVTGAVAATAVATTTSQVLFTVPGTNATIIDETTVNVAVATTAQTGYSNTTSSQTGALGALARNGSTDRLTFVLTPGGQYANILRITNPSAIAGDVTFTLTNDDGTSSTSVGLGSVAGISSDNLGAGASTPNLSVQALFDAAVAADATFALGAGSDKLRIDVIAEFGASGQTTGVIINAFTLSKDANSFGVMNNVNN